MALFLFISIPTLIMISVIIIMEYNISYSKKNCVILLDHRFGFKYVPNMEIYREHDHAYFIYDTKKNKFFIKNETWRVCNHNDYMDFLSEVRNLELEIAGDYWKWLQL